MLTFLKCLCYRRTQRSNVEYTQLKFGASTHFLTLLHHCLGLAHTLGTTVLDHLSYGDKYFLTLVQSRGDNQLGLRFRKCTIIFTLCVD